MEHLRGPAADSAAARNRRAVERYATKRVDFRYRGRAFSFALSHGLFSSAGIDSGSQLLLKVALPYLEAAAKAGAADEVLDAGSGVGVLGIAALGALEAAGAATPRLRAQDRDELARLFTAANAERNGLAASRVDARAEPLLADPPPGGWNLILSNLPAKAGQPVLADFFARSLAVMAPDGLALIVIVGTLAAFARSALAEAGAAVRETVAGSEHAVFVYGAAATDGGPPPLRPDAAAGSDPTRSAAYRRGDFAGAMAGTAYRLTAYHGIADFDRPNAAVELAAKLLARSDLSAYSRALVFEPGQGHFPVWLAESGRLAPGAALALSGRNVLALAAAAANYRACRPSGALVAMRPSVDFDCLDPADPVLSGGFDLIAAFPEETPRVEPALWPRAAELLAPGGLLLVGVSAGTAERLDRSKPGGLIRSGDLKRTGFRALAYRRA
jgi:hypothetical protein